jgi:hypothetical protein
MDSNHRYPEREACFFPGRNSLAGTASRRGRAVGVSNPRPWDRTPAQHPAYQPAIEAVVGDWLLAGAGRGSG